MCYLNVSWLPLSRRKMNIQVYKRNKGIKNPTLTLIFNQQQQAFFKLNGSKDYPRFHLRYPKQANFKPNTTSLAKLTKNKE